MDHGSDTESLGRSRGGLSTKIHLVADRRCRPIARLTSPGQHGDSPRFIPLLRAIRILRRGAGRPRTRPGAVMADKAYSSRANRAHLRSRPITAVCLSKLRQHRAVATRYDKRDRIYQGTIDVASIRIWLRDPAT